MSADAPLHVERLGEEDPDRDAFLLLHGYGASLYSWRHWAEPLARRGRVRLVDMKGFGAADKPDDGRYALADQVAAIESLVERDGLERLTLIGHSLGGGVALLTALAMSERCDPRLARLVLVAGAAYPQRLPPFVTLARTPRLTTAGLRLLGVDRVVRGVLRSIVWDRDGVGAEQVAAYADPLRSRTGMRAALDVARRIVPPDLEALTTRYPRIGVPTLLLWGRHDRVVPLSVGERLAAALPAARLEVLAECGHIPHEERPDASLAVLEAFLDAT